MRIIGGLAEHTTIRYNENIIEIGLILMFSFERFCELVRFKFQEPSESSDYYWKIYQKFSDQTFIPKINWAGFAFGSTLFLYRRMYAMFVVMLVVEQIIESYITTLGFDRGMAHAYGSFIGNVITAFIFNSFYLRFVRRKSETCQSIGIHVRLFYPVVAFLCILFGTLVFQFIGLAWGIYWINVLTNYLLLFGLAYMFVLYIYYFSDWLKNH